MKIALDAIDIPSDRARRKHPPGHIASVAASMASPLGQLEPITVIPNGNRFTLVKGAARIAAAKQLEWSEIEATKLPPARESFVDAHHIAATEVRAPLTQIEKWKSVVRLQEGGATLASAAAMLGLDDRQARQMNLLGRLHPVVMTQLERAADADTDSNFPTWGEIAKIANAPHDMQERAILAATKDNKNSAIAWWKVARDCTSSTEYFDRVDALFDVQKVKLTWSQDVFAEPGARGEWRTTDGKGFMAAQEAALAIEKADREKKKQAVLIAQWDARQQAVKMPKGYQQVFDGDPSDAGHKPKRGQTVILSLRPDGRVVRMLAIDVAAEKAKAKQAQKDAKAGIKPKPAPIDDADEEPDEASSPAPVADISPVTKAGRDMIAAAKTAALAAALREQLAPMGGPDSRTWRDLCALLVVAAHAENVTIGGYAGSSFPPSHHRAAGGDLVARIITPEGHVATTDEDLFSVALRLLERTLKFGAASRPANSYGANPDSGAPADWIGAYIGAGTRLGRFDTKEFLATVNAETLRAAVQSIGVKPAKTATLMRQQLTGNAPTWRPPGTTFGAPGPIPPAATHQTGEAA